MTGPALVFTWIFSIYLSFLVGKWVGEVNSRKEVY